MSSSQESIPTLSRAAIPHGLPLTQLTILLGTESIQGLTKADAEKRLETFGLNELPKIKGSFWQVYLAPIFNGLITIYLIAIIALFILGDQWQSMFWGIIIAFNALLAMVQQYRAQKKLEALQALAADTITVIREGNKQEIDTTLLVPGDLMVVNQGDRIPADSRLVQDSNLTVIEASLTGESAPVYKTTTEEPLPSETPLHSRHNMIYRGTFVATGTGMSVVTSTGSMTELGQINQGLETLTTGEIPLRRKVNRLAIFLGTAVIILLVVSLTSRLLEPLISGTLTLEGLFELTAEAIVNAMTVMPINIPLLTTIVLITGVLVMATHGVIVRDLSAVESLGRISVLCTDKTGTLTRSEMMVTYAWEGQNLFQVTGHGYAPTGDVYQVDGNPDPADTQSEKPVNISEFERLNLLVTIGGLNNDAELFAEKIEDSDQILWRAVGDPTEAALLSLFRKSGLNKKALDEIYLVAQNYPFDSRLKRMTRVFSHAAGGYVVFVKGATDVLLDRCSHLGDLQTTQRLTAKRRQVITDHANKFANDGYRVLSFAVRRLEELPYKRGVSGRDLIEQDLTYVGFVGMVDPPREGVREAVEESTKAGIRTVMITGDALATARTIGEHLAIFREDDLAVEYQDASELSNEDFGRISVFARVNPEHKQVIVQRHKDVGRAVAVTGDGVNDALALSISDVGVAMGITGTDVAKEAADMIIADDSYTSIVKGVRQGRGLFNKIRMMIFFYIAINIAESALFFGTFLAGIPFLTYWQHIFLTISSHSWPGLALVFDRTAKDVMQEKPRNTEALITRQLTVYMAINAIFIIFGVAIAYLFTWNALLPGSELLVPLSAPALQKAQIMALTVLLFAESIMILNIRRINQSVLHSLRHESFVVVYLAIGMVFLMHVGLMYIPAASAILAGFGIDFEYVALSSIDWIVAFSLALPSFVGMEIVKWVSRKRGIYY